MNARAVFNIPELTNRTMVLSAEVIGAIYLGNITYWNDSQILALNSPSVASLLPHKLISIVRETTSSTQTLFTYWLNATVPGWSTTVRSLVSLLLPSSDHIVQVGVGENVTFPIQTIASSRVLSAQGGDQLIALLAATSYSFSFWSAFDVQQVGWSCNLPALSSYIDVSTQQATQLGTASLVNRANNVVGHTLDAVTSAIYDFVASNESVSYHSLVNGNGHNLNNQSGTCSLWPIQVREQEPGPFVFYHLSSTDQLAPQIVTMLRHWVTSFDGF
jgi:ABC-type phosphate transport system substrate-binding protein